MLQPFALVLVLCLLSAATAFLSPAQTKCAGTRLHMGFGDMLKKALANDPNLPPASNPGLTGGQPATVEVEFLPSGKKVKAYLGQDLKLIASAAKVDIKYNCSKGECGTCTVDFNGKKVRTCVSSLPTTSNLKKFTITTPSKNAPTKK
ncbi:hypothetical protein B484DRAFT_447157 [Ochromonadaceae sp. CCMP2298]|nr:hypothetical protein B484DRAFT_447157 [Ochromonadaceae sp. CCMP2298]